MPKESQDPIARKQRELLEKQRLLTSQASSISESISKPADSERDPQAPPVWKNDPDEEVISPGRSGAEKRQDHRKRRQDMLIFFVWLLFLVGVCYGVCYYLIPIYLLPHAKVLSQFTHNIGGP